MEDDVRLTNEQKVKKAQEAILRLNSFLSVLYEYSKNRLDSEDFDNVAFMLEHIKKVSGRLYCDLEAWELL